jgi:hypothetical protein
MNEIALRYRTNTSCHSKEMVSAIDSFISSPAGSKTQMMVAMESVPESGFRLRSIGAVMSVSINPPGLIHTAASARW